MTRQIPRESNERLPIDVTADDDPTTFGVLFAFTVAGTRPTTWTAGTWKAAATLDGDGRWTATALTPSIGPDGTVLAVGRWLVWCKLSGDLDDPVREAGQIDVT